MKENTKGRYGDFGGQYISETLMNELIRLEEAYEFYKKDPEFQAELCLLYTSSICPAESEFRIHRIRSQMIFSQSAKGFVRFMKKFWFRQEWEM